MIYYLLFIDRYFNKVIIVIGGLYVFVRDNGILNVFFELEVWNYFDLIFVYYVCEIFYIRVVKFVKVRCMLMNVDNFCYVLLVYMLMIYVRGK